MTRQSKKSEGDVLLSEKNISEMFDFYQFAKTMASNNGVYPGILTPSLLNSQMQNISLNPMMPTEASLAAALADPKNSEKQLQAFSESFEIFSQPYKRLLSYLATSLSFDLTYTCVNVFNSKEYKTTKYKDDLALLEAELDRFDFKHEFSIAVKEMLRNEAFFCLPRFDGERIVLQEFPASPDYTKITGRWSHGFLWSANMYWFLQPGVNIDMYPSFFKKSFSTLWGDNTNKSIINQYNPSLPPELRGNSSWVFWQDISPSIGYCFKFSPEQANRTPYFSGLFSDLILQPLMRNLQKNISMAQAHKIFSGQVPFLKDAKASVKDQISMTPETLGKFLQLIQSGLNSAIKVVTAPLDQMQGIEFSGDNNLYPEYARNMLAMSGVNTSLIFTSAVKPNQMESQLSLNADENLMTMLYSQFNSFMEYYMNKVTTKYKWKFNFEGTNFFTNRAERLETQTTLMSQGIVLPQKIAAAIGMRYSDMRRQMEEGSAYGFIDKLTPIIAAAQMSGKEGGRPSSKANKLSDSAAQTQDDGGNSNQVK